MPFKNIKVSQPQRSFEEIDRIICIQVLPKIITKIPGLDRYYAILPNGEPSLFPSEAGPMRNQDPREYFALLCLEVGLPYSEIGLWLDECVATYEMKHTDGLTRRIKACKESCLRFDRKKPIYYFDGISRRYLFIQ